MREQHQVSYRELIEQAGISRGALAQAIQEAIQANLLRCIRSGQAAAAGAPPGSSVLELKWHDGEYATDPARFEGFFEGAGHRTYVPNQFFTQLLPREPLSVLKVVGSVIRFSIGFEAKRGFRRQQAALSYQDLHRYSKIASPQDLSQAIQYVLGANYIEQLAPGVFDRNAGRGSKAAVYGLRWASDGQAATENGSKSVAGQRFRIRSGSGSKTVAGQRFKNRSGVQIKPEKINSQQQRQRPAAVGKSDKDTSLAYRRLLEVGFDEAAAKRLASLRCLEHIERQIAWMEKRHPTRNPLGMLRKAIEEDWPEPVNLAAEASSQQSPAMVFARHFYASRASDNHHPVALPSSTDLVAAAALLQALLAIWPDLSLANSHVTPPLATETAPDNAISTRSSRVAHTVVMVHLLPPLGAYHQATRALEFRCSSP